MNDIDVAELYTMIGLRDVELHKAKKEVMQLKQALSQIQEELKKREVQTPEVMGLKEPPHPLT